MQSYAIICIFEKMGREVLRHSNLSIFLTPFGCLKTSLPIFLNLVKSLPRQKNASTCYSSFSFMQNMQVLVLVVIYKAFHCTSPEYCKATYLQLFCTSYKILQDLLAQDECLALLITVYDDAIPFVVFKLRYMVMFFLPVQ